MQKKILQANQQSCNQQYTIKKNLLCKMHFTINRSNRYKHTRMSYHHHVHNPYLKVLPHYSAQLQK